MTAKKKFHISDLLSISTECLVSNDHISGVCKILNHMTGDNLFTHQIPLAVDAVKPDLLQQFPWLKEISKPKLSGEAECVAWVASVADVHGEWHEVQSTPLSWGEHDPMSDFRNQWPDKKVVAVDVDGVS